MLAPARRKGAAGTVGNQLARVRAIVRAPRLLSRKWSFIIVNSDYDISELKYDDFDEKTTSNRYCLTIDRDSCARHRLCFKRYTGRESSFIAC